MAGKRLTQITATSEKNATDDLLMVVDVSDTTGSPQGTSKKTTVESVCASHTTVIPNAQVLTLNTVPRTFVPKESGYWLFPMAIQLGAVWTGTTPANETATFDLAFSYENPATTGFPVGWGGTISYFAYQRQPFVGHPFALAHGSQWYSATMDSSRGPVCLISSAVAKPLCTNNMDLLVWAVGAAPLGGYDLTITTIYQKIKL